MDILMPQLGETVAEGTITKWYKNVGDTVKADEALFDVETDKVATEIPSPVAGVLAEVLVDAGQTVKVGTRLAVLRGAGEPAAASTPAPPADQGTRAASSAPAPAASPPASNRSVEQKLSPVVRRLLAEHALGADAIRGTGRDGRVTRDDVLQHVARRAPTPPTGMAPVQDRQPTPTAVPVPAIPVSTAAPASVPVPAATSAGDLVVPLNNIRRRSGAAMARAWQSVPHVLQAVEADYSRIEAARREKGAQWQAREGYELTYLPFLAWAVCHALGKYNQLNARIEGDALVVPQHVHLGIAVDLNHEGLVVPVIRDAQDRTVPALAREIRRIAVGARSNRLRPDDYAQPTYTISNSGVFGTMITAPIVNPPQVAILSTDGVRKRPVVVEAPEGDSIAIRPVGVLAQTFDHRAVDGAYSAAFLRELKRVVETRAWAEDVG
jgi:2-oxoglutarate dehydrogenase E2 component (dihydrolipoamide succinyltransferase)